MKGLVVAGVALGALVAGGFVLAEVTDVSVPVVFEQRAAPPDQAVVSAIVDGATLEVRSGDRTHRVRLEGVQTPAPATADRAAQCLGPEATTVLGAITPVGSEVRLTYRRDAFQREVVRATTRDGRLANAEVARLGFAQVVRSDDGPFLGQLERAAQEATVERRGLHSPAIGCTVAGQVENMLTMVGGVPEAGPPGARGVELTGLADTATGVRAAADELVWSFDQNRTEPAWTVLEPADRAALADRVRAARDQVSARETTLRAAASAAFSDEATRTAVQAEVNREAKRLADIRKAEARRVAAIRRARAAAQAVALRQALDSARGGRSGSEGSSSR